MKKILFSLAIALASVASLAQEQTTFQLSPEIMTTRPSCLPKELNEVFSGTHFANYSHPEHGSVISWNCPEPDGKFRRYAVVLIKDYKLNPMCSTLGIDRFRLTELQVTTSVYNLLRVCGRTPMSGTSEAEVYRKLLSIGHKQPGQQATAGLLWFPPKAASAP